MHEHSLLWALPLCNKLGALHDHGWRGLVYTNDNIKTAHAHMHEHQLHVPRVGACALTHQLIVVTCVN
jgi:hypothetical protein